MIHTPWPAQLALALVLFAVIFGLGYWRGRQSEVDQAVNRQLDKETRLPRLNDQAAADHFEESGHG